MAAPRTGRRCTVCAHDERAAIDRALVRGAPFREVAAQYKLTKSAVERHHKQHVPQLLRDAAESEAAEEERLTAAALLKDLRELQRTARRLGIKAEKGGDLQTALRAVAELRGLLAVGLRGVETAELEERLDALEATLPDTGQRRTA
jgi:methylthioribose-1-phosphate isomerase